MSRSSFGYSNSPDARIGENPYEHLYLLTELRARTQSQHRLIQHYIKPGMSFLDLGCGSLGIFAIIASKLGASRIVGVDQGNVMTAAAVAADNNVTNIEWISSRVQDLVLEEKFDIVSGTIWLDYPWDNLPIIQLYRDCISKFARSDSIVIPNLIEITAYAVGINFESQPLAQDIQTAEEDTGLNLNFLRRDPDNYFYKQFLFSSREPRVIGKELKKFTVEESFSDLVNVSEIDFLGTESKPSIPQTISFTVTKSGYLTSIQWIQRVRDQFTKELFREIRTVSQIGNPRIVSQISNPRAVSEGEKITIEIPDTMSWIARNGAVRLID